MKKLLLVPTTVLALTLSVSACGDDDKDNAGGSVSTPPSPPAYLTPGNIPGEQDTGNLTKAQRKALRTLRKVADCMRSKGYSIDDPKPGDFGVTPKNAPDAAKANKDSAECVKQAGS